MLHGGLALNDFAFAANRTTKTPRHQESPFPKETDEVASKIVDAAIAVHRARGPGLLESVYEVCLMHELNKRGLKREESIPQTFGNVLSSDWIPAFAGMTGGSSGSPFQLSPRARIQAAENTACP